jgi:hypothetical protein
MQRKRIFFWFQRLFYMLMALHVINLSVDAPDQHIYVSATGVIQEDLTFNEIESISEWILEHVLGIDDAVPEHDEPDTGGAVYKIHIKLSLPQRLLFIVLPSKSVAQANSVKFLFLSLPYLSCAQEINAPPPRLG